MSRKKSRGRARQTSTRGNAPPAQPPAVQEQQPEDAARPSKRIPSWLLPACVAAAVAMAGAGAGYTAGSIAAQQGHEAEQTWEQEQPAIEQAAQRAVEDALASRQAAETAGQAEPPGAEQATGASAAASAAAGSEEAASPANFAENDGHVHIWADKTETVTTDPVYETIHRAAVYSTVVEEHVVCNECGTDIEGREEEHLNETGHSDFTRKVPVKIKRLVSKASDERALKTPAATEQRTVGRTCTLCGRYEKTS